VRSFDFWPFPSAERQSTFQSGIVPNSSPWYLRLGTPSGRRFFDTVPPPAFVFFPPPPSLTNLPPQKSYPSHPLNEVVLDLLREFPDDLAYPSLTPICPSQFLPCRPALDSVSLSFSWRETD